MPNVLRKWRIPDVTHRIPSLTDVWANIAIYSNSELRYYLLAQPDILELVHEQCDICGQQWFMLPCHPITGYSLMTGF